MKRLGLRTRVMIAFTAAMALVLLGLGLFISARYEAQLNDAIDQGLRSRAGEVEALIRDSPRGLHSSARSLLIESEETFAVVLKRDGTVLDETPQLQGDPVLSAAERASASGALHIYERAQLPGIEGGGRFLATPVTVDGRHLIAVVGASLGDRRDALAGLRRVLLLGGVIALVLTTLAGFLAITAALRPVEAMRRKAADIAEGGHGQELPVPPGSDALARLGTTLNAMLARLTQAIERERRFVDDASHELRTPLALHKTELELAQRYGSSEAELRSSIASATEEVDRLIGLSESLLLVARSGGEAMHLDRSECESHELLAGVARRFEARAGNEGRTISVEPGSIAFSADRLRVEQALTALVDNALRHGGGTVTLRAERTDDAAVLHVIDGGRGFETEFLPRAFERFSTSDEARTSGGTGLGLAIVDAIAGAHGGCTGAANLAGGGADVWIGLPASA
jgi:two-component system OmpR family sensor kinase